MRRRAARATGSDPGHVRGLTLLVAACVVAAGCGSTETSTGTGPLLTLPGWRAVADPPGIGELAPDLGGLHPTRRTDSAALVRAGDAIRASTIVFATRAEAAEALTRVSADQYEVLLFRELHGRITRLESGNGAGYRLGVGRPAEPGRDTVEIYAVRRGRTLVLVELVSAAGFDRGLRDRILAAVSR